MLTKLVTETLSSYQQVHQMFFCVTQITDEQSSLLSVLASIGCEA